jgi:ribosomal protein S18 acetylase RimI-like enzyme
LRPLRAGDLPALAVLGSRAADELERGAAVDVLVAVVEGRVVGVGAVDHVARPGAGVLFLLLVDPDHRSRGLGTSLVQALETCAHGRGAGVTEIEVDAGNDRALALYERLGYRRVGVVGPDGSGDRRRVLRRTPARAAAPPG